MNYNDKYLKYKNKYLLLKNKIQRGGNILLNNVKIIEKLGSGNYGNVYLVEYNNNKYALKIEYIEEKDVNNNLSSNIWREIYFAENFAIKYPDFFMNIYSHDIIEKCKEIKTNKQIFIDKNDNVKKDYYCSRKLYSLIETTLSKLNIKKINELYSMIIQLFYIVYLMQNENYIHNDFNAKNIGIKYTNNKTIKIFDYEIPLYGKMFVLIDYGKVLSNKFILNKKEQDKYNNMIYKESDNIFFGYILDIFNFKNKNFYKKKYVFEDDYSKFIKTDKFTEISKITDDAKFQIYLYDMLYQKQHIQDLYGKNSKILENNYLIPKEDIIFYIKSGRDFKKNITYFYNRLQK